MDKSPENSNADAAQPKRMKLRIPHRYRLSFFNDGTLNRVWTIGMSRRRMWFYIGVVCLLIALAGACMISFTPLKVLLPGYLRPAERREYIAASEKLDSIVERANQTDAYLNNIENILSDNIPADSLYLVPPPPASLQFDDESLQPSTAEAAYLEQYLAKNSFDLTLTGTGDKDVFPIFSPPVDNAMVKRGSKPSATRILLTGKMNPVRSIASGTVVDAAHVPGGKTKVVVQHADGYLSVYGGLDEAKVAVGDKVVKGGRIGTVHANGDNTTPLDFALWRNGTLLQPLDFVPF